MRMTAKAMAGRAIFICSRAFQAASEPSQRKASDGGSGPEADGVRRLRRIPVPVCIRTLLDPDQRRPRTHGQALAGTRRAIRPRRPGPGDRTLGTNHPAGDADEHRRDASRAWDFGLEDSWLLQWV